MELDDNWFELTREVLDATGIRAGRQPGRLPVGSLRIQANGLGIATVIHQDGRWVRLHNDAYFARSACVGLAYGHGVDEPR